MKPLLIKHLEGEPIGRFPVWMMRQAGRYLPSYRALRKSYGFWEMVSQPELAAEVTLLPLKELSVDGLILFSDILTLPYGLGLGVRMEEAVGPVLENPLTRAEDFQCFRDYSPQTHTPYVGKALRAIRAAAPAEVAVLGFAGAPWTVATYLIHGRGKRFDRTSQWVNADPDSLALALSRLEEATTRYLIDQVESGAELLQLFDTWLSEMPRHFFVKHYVPMLNRIFTALKTKRVPTIYFTKNAHHLLSDFKTLTCDALSVDSLLTLSEVEARTEGKFCLQGNLDPHLLLGPEPQVRALTRRLVMEARTLTRPAILNLAHGIFPQTPVENARAFIDEARALWI